MARIAAVIGPPAADGQAGIEQMLAAAGHGPVSVAACGPARFGVRGSAPGALSERDGVLVAVDGRIYDAPDLAAAEGPAALVHRLYEQHGFEGAMQRLNGDFGVVLFDAGQDVLYAARDRFGLQPLYHAATRDGFAVASQPRQLIGLHGVSRDVDPRFVACFAGSHYRTFDNEPTRSPYVGIDQLPAGHWLRRKGGATTVAPYWALHDQPDLDGPESELAERYRDLLLDAVAIRLRAADRPVFTLSGGMDSSSVLACAVRASGVRQRAYSTVYDDATYDESAEIRTLLDDLVSEWRPVRIGVPDLERSIRRMIAVNDEPVATATWLSHYLLCEQAASEGVGTLFGGLGGDELNAGEYEYFYYFFADVNATGDAALLERETARWIEHHDHPVFRKSFDAMRAGLQRLVDPARPGVCLPDRARLGRYQDAVAKEYFDLAGFTPVMDHPFTSYLKNRTYQDIFRETAPCCLRAADRHAAALGMSVVWPFFDHRLVELMFRVRSTQKIRDGVTKHLLREAMRGVLPEETRTRIKKTGWNAPAHIWFVDRGRELVLDILSSQRFRERGIYELARVREIVDEHEQIVRDQRVADNHMMFLWQLVNLELWFRDLETTS